ncbi:unnamed protein product [Lactuca saligna]|uniref:Uncharacterized protein n=1 Tax=Lactuca saligna TaxID=75948 RepID=A0AA35ZLH4_LACSI|nr:unnamed protein product [Lactuca saligna]
MYCRFLQILFDALRPELERNPDDLDVKSLGPNTFGLMKQVRKASKVVFKGTEALVKFGKSVETEGVHTASTPIIMVVEEHVAPSISNISFSFEVSDDDDDDDDEEEEEEEDVRMFESSKELVNEDVTSPTDTEKEINIFKKPNNPMSEQMEALIEKLQLTVRKPCKQFMLLLNLHLGVIKTIQMPS